MSFEKTSYHPVVEEHVETSGMNAGRLKNTEFTRDIANAENAARDLGVETDSAVERERQERNIAGGLASTAVKKALEIPIHNKVAAEVGGNQVVDPVDFNEVVGGQINEVTSDYSRVQEAAGVVKEARESVSQAINQ